jgi:hypothetical protein
MLVLDLVLECHGTAVLHYVLNRTIYRSTAALRSNSTKKRLLLVLDVVNRFVIVVLSVRAERYSGENTKLARILL